MHARGATVSLGATAAGVVHVGGVAKCSSSWACPVCAPTIGERRAAEIDQAVTAWRKGGGRVYFVTATMAHTAGTALATTLEMLQLAWSRTVRQGLNPHPWYGGQVRAIEVTFGRSSGWHPHIHAAVFIEAGFDADDWAALELRSLSRVWAESVALLGGHTRVTPVRRKTDGALVIPGWDVSEVIDAGATAQYLSKIEGGWGIGLELGRLDLKTGKGLSPAQLLRAGVEGDPVAAGLYLEYERATAGRHRIEASPGLLKRCGVDQLTDEEAADAEPPEPFVLLAVIPADDWRRIMAAGFAGVLIADLARAARGEGDGWAWPPGWLSTS